MRFDKLKLPTKLPNLTEDMLCQGRNELNDSKDLLTWIDSTFDDHYTRNEVEKMFAEEVGVRSHALIKWSDGVTKREIVEIWNKVIKRLKDGVKAV